MKFDSLVSHDFMIVASVLLLSALFNKTLINVLGNYEAFATGTSTTTSAPSSTQQFEASVKSLGSAQTWTDFFTSKSFWMPNLINMLTIIWFFTWLFLYVLKRRPSVNTAF